MELTEEKRRRILNAALGEFAKHDYKGASTDDIAAKAGISKGLLFYYYKNKLSLYLACYRCAMDLMLEQTRALRMEPGSDFFAVMERGAQAKLEITRSWPYLMDFSIRAWYSRNEAVSGAVQKLISKDTDAIYRRFFRAIDRSKFKEDVDPAYLLKMLTWMVDGYMNEKRRVEAPLDVDEMMEDYRRWAQQFRRMAYKEEYQ